MSEGPDPAPESPGEGFSSGLAVTQRQTQTTENAAAVQSSPNKWCCSVCTYENFPSSQKCTMCGTAAPNAQIYQIQETPGGTETVCERLQPLRISTPPPINKWPCPLCTYENWPAAQRCAMCSASRPSTPHHAQPQHDEPRINRGSNDILASQQMQTSSVHELRNNKRRNIDWLWLEACLGVLEGSVHSVEQYLSSGGDPARSLTLQEAGLLDRPSAFDAGHTLIHLAIRFQREDILSLLLSRVSGGGPGLKRAPSYIAPDIALAIRRHFAGTIRTKKGNFPCKYTTEFVSFTLPNEIEELPSAIQEELFQELLDQDAQQTLEQDHACINWSPHLSETLGSRLFALWNRSAGDCLLDAVLQSSWGVFDRDNTLRRALAESLINAHRSIFERWEQWECYQAAILDYTPSENQLRDEWNRMVGAAQVPGTPLHQLHIFVLAHIMRRPIIVYGVDVVNSFRGDPIGFARFQGVYIPLLWEAEFCSKCPLAVAYTRGHFSALVAMEPQASSRYICRGSNESGEECTFLPLTDSEGKLLPVHFLNCDEVGSEEALLRRWLRVCSIPLAREGAAAPSRGLSSSRGPSSRGLTGLATPVAAARPPPRPLLAAQLLEEWLNHYRSRATEHRGPHMGHHALTSKRIVHDYSSDADTDDD